MSQLCPNVSLSNVTVLSENQFQLTGCAKALILNFSLFVDCFVSESTFGIPDSDTPQPDRAYWVEFWSLFGLPSRGAQVRGRMPMYNKASILWALTSRLG